MKPAQKRCSIFIKLCIFSSLLVLILYFWLANNEVTSRGEIMQHRLVILKQMHNYAKEVCVDKNNERSKHSAQKNESQISSVNINKDVTIILMTVSPECAKLQKNQLKEMYKNVKVLVAASNLPQRPKVLNAVMNSVQTEYFITIDETIDLSNNHKGVIEKLLTHMMDFDVLGSAETIDGVYHISCYSLHLRQWTLTSKYEYHANGNILRCMSTLSFFIGRTKVFKHNPFDDSLPSMWLEDFFIRLNNTIRVGVLPEVTIYRDQQTTLCHHGNLSMVTNVDGFIPFANKYQIFFIASDERYIDLCYDSMALVCNIANISKTWKTKITSGLTTYPFVISALKKTVHFGDEWLREYDIPYVLEGGTSLGMIKVRDILPWDHGDIDTFAYCTRRQIVNMVVGVFRRYGIDYKLGGIAFHLYLKFKSNSIGDIVFMIKRMKPTSFIYVRHDNKLLSLSREIFQFLRDFYGPTYFENHLKYTNERTYCKGIAHHACMSDCRWHGCGGGTGIM